MAHHRGLFPNETHFPARGTLPTSGWPDRETFYPHCVGMGILELIIYPRPASNSLRSCLPAYLCLPSAGVEDLCHSFETQVI